MRQAIVTKYIGPTNYRGSRVTATAAAGSITVYYRYGSSSDDNHKRAAKALIEKLGWSGTWHAGVNPDGRGNVYVCEDIDPRDRFTIVATQQRAA